MSDSNAEETREHTFVTDTDVINRYEVMCSIV